MEMILLTLSPFVVAVITQLVKGLGFVRESSGIRRVVFRFVAALLSFGGVTLSALLAGQEVDMTSITTFAETLLVFLGATGTYFLTKKKS